MKKTIAAFAALLFAVALASAQAGGPAVGSATPASPSAAPAALSKAVLPDMAKSESRHYTVYAEISAERAADLDSRLEALFGLFGSYFHFDPALLPVKLRVREFRNKAGFDAYLNQVAGQTKDDFVYVHYSSLERSELVIYQKDGSDAESSLAHQAFVQYLKAFIRNPPLWLRDGLAVYFESAHWDQKAKALVFPENLAWLETAKAINAKKSFLPLTRLLTLSADDAKANLDVFYPEAWAFVSFLTGSEDKAHNRMLWDALSALKPEASLADNQAIVAKLFGDWLGTDSTEAAFIAYLGSKKTFAELVNEGVSAYGSKNYTSSRSAFESAAKLDSSSYIPPYYLGLIAYSLGEYALAETSYRGAMALGCDEATSNYALGVNAFAQNRAEEAKAFLLAAKAKAPDRYGTKADELLKRLGM